MEHALQPILLFSVFTVCITLCGSDSCRKIDACSCAFDDDSTIDLHLSDGAEDGKPVFQFQTAGETATYMYSPCSGLSCGQSPNNDTTICKRPPDFPIGNVSSATFETEGTVVRLLYRTNGNAVTSRVQLVCSDKEQFTLVASGNASYNFTLQTLCACPGVCSEDGVSMSVGTVLVLIFFSASSVYFGTGCLYRKALHGASGLELLPHNHFWRSLPSLVQDGYMFFISPCLGNRAEYRTYDRL